MPKHQMPDLIVLLPGIMGSVLKKDGRAVWGFGAGTIARALFTLGDSIATGLHLDGDDPVLETLDDGISADALIPDLHLLPGFWRIDGYGHVAETIRTLFDVREGENFFSFPYDWRRDNRAAAHRLRRSTHEWLARWRRESPEAKLILIAHSMGGIVARYFLEVLEGWKDAKALLTFGTPYRGSLSALDTLSNGMRKGPLTLHSLTAFGRSCTSIYQLLPIYESYDAGDGKLARVGECSGIPHVDPIKAQAALAFHHEIIDAVDRHLDDEAYRKGRYRVVPMVGITQETLQSASLTNGKVVLTQAYKSQDMSGDGTVPRVSAIPHEYGDAGNAMYAAMKHSSLQNTPSILQHLEGAITELYLNLGKFLEPDRRIQLSLNIDDAFFDDEPIPIHVDAGEPHLELTVTVVNSSTDKKVEKVNLTDRRDGTYTAQCGPLPPGSYSFRVGGDETVSPVADAAGVCPRVS